MMQKSIIIIILILLVGCTHRSKGPDVSNIKVELTVERFDLDFFSMDTIGIEKGLGNLEVKYPSLYPIFMQNILGLHDSARDKGTLAFIRQNRFIADAINKEFTILTPLKNDFENAFRHVRYYFPAYIIPKLITIAGPPDALAQTTTGELTPDFIGPDFLGISLQFYLGKDFPLYKDEFFITNIAPEFRSRRFDKKYIVSDAMKLIADDIYPDKSTGKGLIEQMIEKGKQWWLLDKFLPDEPDSIKTGYTKNQLEWCKENEGLIWNSIITNEKDIFTREPASIQNYIGEAPFTQVMSTSSPGNIGQWVGWQIMKKYAEKNSSLSIDEIMKKSAKEILEETKYKPK